ncbi:amidohydrolase family protein [Marinobacter zhejiangensis]|uniref:5-methylthioadenosine/S-adenosylhomocysteine deaminase n=1 Tax=Marinobacter zhejiangensis TaxID=488535 RepID=A0A1I4NT55_9GAMM|nr:amidohydrolase family protein [Marinobacter zhejiangensis]SFM18702.1 5-methylthioadenosine/S-adenosylhomocysteine deaminase [Marinobacter zhejiangensis]
MFDSENPADLVIHGAHLLTVDPHLGEIPLGRLVIHKGRFVEVGPDDESRALPPARRVIDLSGHVVTPGFINVHTHTILTMVRGVAEDMGFAPAYTAGVPHGHDVTEEEAVALARLGAAEALLFGSTLINDSFVHANQALPAMGELGLRVIACGRIHDVDFTRVHEGIWNHRSAIGEKTLGQAIALHERWQGQMDGRLGVELAAHAPDTCSRQLLAQVAEVRDALGIQVNGHLSQSRTENQRVFERDGMSPTELLEDVGLLGPRFTAAHCMYVSDSDIARLGASRTNVAHVPRGNATGGRIAPTQHLRTAGANLALATDNMHADMVEVMRWALIVGRLQAGEINDSWQPHHVLEMATMGGARALGLQDDLGSLSPGKRADLVAFNFRRPHLVPVTKALGNLVHTAQGRDVELVVCNGDVVVEQGVLCRADSEVLLADAQQAADALWRRARAQGTGNRACQL